jgi:flavin-dependent dehydrogenase
MGSRYCTRGKLSSVYAELPGNAPAWSRTLVETAADGWWYATGLPGGNVLAAFQTDSGTARRLRHDPVEWLLRLRATQIVAASCMFDPAPQIVLSICDAGARHLEARFGASWLAIGDAAAAYDPVTSHGLYAAINDGIDGAAAVSQALTGSNRAVADFDDRRVARHRFVERQRLAAYARETRWPDAPFWASRRSA